MQSAFKYLTTTSSVILLIIMMLFCVEMSCNVEQNLCLYQFCECSQVTLYKKTVIFRLIFIIIFCFRFGINVCFFDITCYMMGHAVVQLVEALRYKPEVSRVRFPVVLLEIFHWYNHGCTMALGSTQPLTEMSNRNISWGGKGDWCVGLTTLPPFCANCLEICEPQPSGTLRACPGL